MMTGICTPDADAPDFIKLTLPGMMSQTGWDTTIVIDASTPLFFKKWDIQTQKMKKGASVTHASKPHCTQSFTTCNVKHLRNK